MRKKPVFNGLVEDGSQERKFDSERTKMEYSDGYEQHSKSKQMLNYFFLEKMVKFACVCR